MPSQSFKNNIKNPALLFIHSPRLWRDFSISLREAAGFSLRSFIFSLSFFTLVFTQASQAQDQAVNRGYIAASNLSETRKGTVVFKQRADAKTPLPSDKHLTELQKQARIYRAQGYEAQAMGNLDVAVSFYQKAMQLDPGYAIVYNDLGIIYEDAGLIDRAEQHYLKAVKLDPGYLSAYSNLALLYESKRDLEKAVFYWKKRVELGASDDPWTARARKRLNDLAQVLPSYKQALAEADTINLIRQVSQNKQAKQEVSFKQAAQYFASAKNFYNRGQYDKAMEDINKALAADPQDKEKLWLKEKISFILKERYEKAKAKERAENARKMRMSFEQGLKYYQQGNADAAGQEFDKVTELTATPQKK